MLNEVDVTIAKLFDEKTQRFLEAVRCSANRVIRFSCPWPEQVPSYGQKRGLGGLKGSVEGVMVPTFSWHMFVRPTSTMSELERTAAHAAETFV